MSLVLLAQWKERVVLLIFRGDWRVSEIVSGLALLSTGRSKLRIVDGLMDWTTPLGITYTVTGYADILCGFAVLVAVMMAQGKTGNARARGVVNIIQLCLWTTTAYIYWLGLVERMFETQIAMWEDHFSAVVVVLTMVVCNFFNLAGIVGLNRKGEQANKAMEGEE